MKPILFLDFDGVINALPYKRNWIGPDGVGLYDPELNNPKNWEYITLTPNEETHFPLDTVKKATHRGREYTITYSAELVDALRELIVEDKVHFIWLTTWREATQTELNPMLDFPADKAGWIEWQDTNLSYDNPQLGKFWGLCDYIERREREGSLEKDTPLMWVDDVATIGFNNLSDYEMEYRKKHPTPLERYPSLVLTTNADFGISRAELKSLQSFK